jgi:hypothetical protein
MNAESKRREIVSLPNKSPIQGPCVSSQVPDRLSQFVQQPLQPFILICPFNPQRLDFYAARKEIRRFQNYARCDQFTASDLLAGNRHRPNVDINSLT